jgi:hypothetical protein
MDVEPVEESKDRGFKGEEGRFSLLFEFEFEFELEAVRSGKGARNKERGSSDSGGREDETVELEEAVEVRLIKGRLTRLVISSYIERSGRART